MNNNWPVKSSDFRNGHVFRGCEPMSVRNMVRSRWHWPSRKPVIGIKTILRWSHHLVISRFSRYQVMIPLKLNAHNAEITCPALCFLILFISTLSTTNVKATHSMYQPFICLFYLFSFCFFIVVFVLLLLLLLVYFIFYVNCFSLCCCFKSVFKFGLLLSNLSSFVFIWFRRFYSGDMPLTRDIIWPWPCWFHD